MHYDIAIVGLGPIGCTAALLCAEFGLKVIAIERDIEVYRLPRAVNLDGEIVRAFQRIDRAEAVDSLMQKVRPGDRAGFANSKREWLFGQDFTDFGANGWQPMNMFDQPEFEQYLRDETVCHPNVTALIGSEVTHIENVDSGVTLNVIHLKTKDQQALRATYAIGCDGASSFVRRTFDISWHDQGYDCNWLVVDIILKQGHTLGNDTLQVCDPDRITTYVCTKDPYRRWEFKMHPDETREQMLETETIQLLIDEWTARGTYEIRRAAVYQFHAATADVWRIGNIFIAGDAAHQTPPFLGQGMNAGMRDVINLSWKLQLVVSGVANDGLLDTYELERKAHASDLVEWAVSIGRLMEHTAEVEAAVRDGKKPPEAPVALHSSGYGQGRDQPPIRSGAVCLEQVSDTGSTGYLFRQPNVHDRVGRTCKLDELLGPGFAVVGKTEKILKLNASSKRVLEKIGAQVISLEDLTVVRGHVDRLFSTNDAVIIRPDRLIFGHTTEDRTLDGLIEILASELALTNY